MAKKAKTPAWDRKPCGCVKTKLPRVGKVLIRCERHREKPYKGKRVLCYWDDSGLVQRKA
jgi:hypothetical protein